VRKRKRNKNEFDEDQLRRYILLSPEEKLKGLEAMNAFLTAFTPPKAKRIREELKKRGW